MRKKANIPVFVPHLGCPNDCVFCDQRTISGVKEFRPEDAVAIIDRSLATIKDKDAEIAFFGGSFTGIDRKLMRDLLDLAQSYVDEKRVCGIRFSTRPDYIDDEVIEILKKYTLSEVEIGIQSMDNRVLEACRRGHRAEDTEKACSLLRESGIKFVGQMMIGLPDSSGKSERECAEKIVSMGASGARIYPTLVLKGTCLYEMTERGEYTPLDLSEAVSRSADVYEIFLKGGVRVIRTGLCESESLHSSYGAGPEHPAMGELVVGELMRRKIEAELEKSISVLPEKIRINVAPGKLSPAIGQKGSNRAYLEARYNRIISFGEDSGLSEFDISIKALEERERST